MSGQPRPSPRDGIFISYRRDDARGASGRLYDWLRIAFGRDRVFRDVHSLGVGKWRDKIDAALARSAVCVAVIGPRWANADNLPRLNAADDMVRHELVTALGIDPLVMVPTLVEGQRVQDVPLSHLSAELRPLFDQWNVREVTEAGWEDDTRRLIGEIAQASGLRVGAEVDAVLRQAGEASQRMADFARELHLPTGQGAALHDTVDALTHKLADAAVDDRQGLSASMAALAQGDTRAAEAAFERDYERHARAGPAASAAAAEAARNVGNLALLRDVAKAASFYRKALAAEPTDIFSGLLLGKALVALGDLKGAQAALNQALRQAFDRGHTWGQMAAHDGLGEVFRKLGDMPAAQRAFTRALTLARQGGAAEPDSDEWQNELATSHTKIGRLHRDRGDGTAALAAFGQAHAIVQALAARDPGNTQWQRELALSHLDLGDALLRLQDPAAALRAFRQGHAIVEHLAAQDPGHAQAQDDLAIGLDRIARALYTLGEDESAAAACRGVLAIHETLMARDPANTRWQECLATGYRFYSVVLLAQGHAGPALAASRKGLPIVQALAARDPRNVQWQYELALAHERIGAGTLNQGDSAAALSAFRQSLAVCAALVAHDAGRPAWQCHLGDCHQGIGDALGALGQSAAAVAAYRQALEVRARLSALDPGHVEWQNDLALTSARLGSPDSQLPAHERRGHLLRGRDIQRRLKAAGQLQPDQDWSAWFERKLAELPS